MIPRHLMPWLMLSLAGCHPWVRVPMPAPARLPNDRVQVWLGRHSLLVREVVVEADTIRGVARPTGPHPSDSAVVVPSADVDSIRLRLPNSGNWFGVGFLGGLVLGIGAMLALFASNTT